jgi:hypothetical protein
MLHLVKNKKTNNIKHVIGFGKFVKGRFFLNREYTNILSTV